MILSLRHLIICSSFILLTACASVNAPPTCPDSTGVQCARVDQLDNMVDSGRLGETSSANNTVKSAAPMQVWLAPYQDSRGNYHPARVIERE